MARVFEWVVDEQNTQVRVSAGLTGRILIQVNGQEVQRVNLGMGMKSTSLLLPSSARADFHYGPGGGAGVRCELRLGGRLLLPYSAPKGSAVALSTCPHCKADVRVGDRLCKVCGERLPSVEEIVAMNGVRRAMSLLGIGALSISFIIFSVIQRDNSNQALEQIAAFGADAPLANPTPGVAARTVGELRTQIEWEANSVLIVNLALAALMLGLWRWGKSHPTRAMIVGLCACVVATVTNVVIDPQTIEQDLIFKIIVFAYFVGGLKAALALRSAKASAA